MRRFGVFTVAALLGVGGGGCAGLSQQRDGGEKPPAAVAETPAMPASPASCDCPPPKADAPKDDGPPKTLFAWLPGEDKPAGDKKEEEDTIKTDRPDFTEASNTVGKGRLQFEMGYTFFSDRADGVRTHTHSYPELLVRAGLFAEWFELRIGQNISTTRTRSSGGGMVPMAGDLVERASGADDLYIGTKIALTEQKGILPELAIITQATVPTGVDHLTSSKFLPGLSLLYSWDLSEKWALAGSVLGNKAVEEGGHSYYEFANSLSLGHTWTEKLGSYVEYFGFYPSGAVGPDIKPQYYVNGGFTYLITKTIQFDIRAGVGLSPSSADYFVGSGLAFKF